MTEHSPNDQFHASSFMQGQNAQYLEQMYARYASNRLVSLSVIPTWHSIDNDMLEAI